jgi:hypothetical protein
MDELMKKIATVRDLAKSLLAKPGQSSLVPALKIPAPKPLSMPSTTGKAPTKLPGAAITSNKDPKAVATQLKNPRPIKPKIEVMKTAANGQWSLEKDEDENPVQIHAYLPSHIAQMGHSAKPGSPEFSKYVDAAFDWHDKVHRAIMHDNPHLKHSFGENLHPRIHGYNGEIKSTKALDKLHIDNKAHYSFGGEGN